MEDIPASGGSISSGEVSYSQRYHYYYSSGQTEEVADPITTGGQVTFGDPVTAESLGTTIKDRTIIGQLTCQVAMNGQTSVEGDASVYQAGNSLENTSQTKTISVSPETLYFSSFGDTKNFTFQALLHTLNTYTSGSTSETTTPISSEEITLTSSNDWVSYEYKEDNTYSVTVVANTDTAADRQGSITLSTPGVESGSKSISTQIPIFQYRRVGGIVVGSKAYGRSNDEDAEKRKYLYDYSGNGRDIELFNFAFSKMSGYNGYTQDFLEFSNSPKVSRTSTKIIVNKIDEGISTTLSASIIPDRRFRLKFRISGLNQPIPEGNPGVLTFRIYDNGTSPVPIDYKEDGIYEVDYTLTEDATLLYFFCFISSFLPAEIQPITIEQLPLYPGALVSDGIDDYGQCIKGFALPDDYTVVAVRKQIAVKSGILVSKGNVDTGAFGFEGDGPAAYSYGKYSSVSDAPALFSYQTKSSYNGLTINVGTGTDTTEDKLRLFNNIPSSNYVLFALYDLRIYDHSLTAEELQAVKDEMLSDFENATGGV